MAMQISENGLQLIESFEAFRSSPYYASETEEAQGIATIGYGSTFYANGSPVKITDAPITQTQAEVLLKDRVQACVDKLNFLIKVSVTQNQFDALVSLSYNIGLGAFQASSVLRVLNTGDYAGAADHFLDWEYQNHVKVAGLINRRTKERALFLES